MAPITKGQIQRIYALGSGVGILESGNKDDDLHALVHKLTGKRSVSELTGIEFAAVERELLRLMRYPNRPAPLKKNGRKKEADDVPGMMTSAQQGKAWRLIYRLIELDNGNKADAGKRMCGAIRKILDIDAGTEAPMRWVNFTDGEKLIEKLKRYVRTAEKKAKEAG